MTINKNSFHSAVHGRGKLLLLVLMILLSALPVFAQDEQAELDPALSDTDTSQKTGKEDFWICPGAEIALYSSTSASYGGSLALGYGRGTAIGLKAAYFTDPESDGALEINLLLRFYFLGGDYYQGTFIQFNGGPVLFFSDNQIAFPANLGMISAGLSLGWRFLLGKWGFVEPSLRVGYPYLVGGGLSFGLHN
ncbi:MAG: hypothetical protein LBB72_04570 [Spirochaetaceae bacterium]|jgi:hypothetical protein|nr:hypothetical protein [Spirochaetaceae bacterium]